MLAANQDTVNRAKDRPDRDQLAQRYERFKAAA